MSKEEHYPPIHAKEKFHCPHCGVYAKQRWSHLSAVGDVHTNRYYDSNIKGLTQISSNLVEEWSISICEHCNGMIIWKGKTIIYPKEIQVAKPNTDLNADIQEDYLEAANVLSDSPRSAAAILRLALQKLCKQLGEKGENINEDIAALVKKGLNPTIQKSLDALRITGNNAVHPGELDLKEDAGRVMKLFGLVNFIAEKMLTEPKEINSFYEELPEGAKKAVEKRDK
ncbi:MAG TPA: DUF4145 domain-containing protein [Candidatus Paceibacterota bacterium]|nr:DUF4145 domain-containing protein [Candidatus Paceibacterota bacterium]